MEQVLGQSLLLAAMGPSSTTHQHQRPTQESPGTYAPDMDAPELDAPITRDGLFMVDSGGQYLDGTTDVTRTFHYGTPTEEMIERYTDVLQVLFASFYQKHQ